MSEQVLYSTISGWKVDGENIKRNGQRRKWNAKLTGMFRYGVRGDKQVQVIDLDVEKGNKKKWLSLSTFTGTLGSVKLVEGNRPDGHEVFNV